jgi:aspartyl protease family protein
MRWLRGFLVIHCLLLASAATAQDADVRVIALFTDKALLQVGDQQKIVTKGETFEGVLLQSATGRGAVVVIDGETMTLDLNQSIAGNYKKREAKLRIVRDSRGMYFANGKINGHATRFLVDTGATLITISGSKARELKIDFTKGERSIARTAAAVVGVWQVQLDSVSVGGITLNNVDATVIPGTHPAEVLLGNSFLKRTEIKQADSVLELRKRY